MFNYQVLNNLSVYGGVYNLLDKQIGYDSYGRVLDDRAYNAGITFNY